MALILKRVAHPEALTLRRPKAVSKDEGGGLRAS
jgi:hypothetical protein